MKKASLFVIENNFLKMECSQVFVEENKLSFWNEN